MIAAPYVTAFDRPFDRVTTWTGAASHAACGRKTYCGRRIAKKLPHAGGVGCGACKKALIKRGLLRAEASR